MSVLDDDPLWRDLRSAWQILREAIFYVGVVAVVISALCWLGWW